MRADLRLAALLGSTGLLPAALAFLPKHTPLLEFGTWTALAALVWVPLARRRRAPPFGTLLLAGVAAGVVVGVLQAATTDWIVRADPSLGAATPRLRAVFLVSALVIGAVWGALVGGIAVGLEKWRPATAPA